MNHFTTPNEDVSKWFITRNLNRSNFMFEMIFSLIAKRLFFLGGGVVASLSFFSYALNFTMYGFARSSWLLFLPEVLPVEVDAVVIGVDGAESVEYMHFMA